MHFKLISWIVIFTILTTFIIQENPFSVTKEPQEIILPSINFTIHSTSNSIEISTQTTNQTEFLLHAILSNASFEDSFEVQKDLERLILEQGEVLFINSMNSSKFFNLDANSTYYLYYFQRDPNLKYKTPIYSQEIQTKPIVNITTLHSKIPFETKTIIITVNVCFLLAATLSYYFKRRALKKLAKLQKISLLRSPKCSNDTEIRQLKKITKAKIQEFEEKKLCGLCCDRPREVIFLECGHIYTCGKCSQNLDKCPLDKKWISAKFNFRICDKFGINANYINELEINSLKQHHYDHLGLCYDKVKGYLNAEKKYDLLKEKFDNYNYFEKCIKCNQQRKDTFFVDCGHLVCCRGCSEAVDCCPIDRVDLTRKVQVYFA